MRVSVVIPCYNAQSYLAQTLRSVLDQQHRIDEIIVVDDGSTDRSAAIAMGFRPRVELLVQAHAGASAACNHGARQATGEALMFLDADGVLGPTVIAGLVDALARRPGSIAACRWHRLESVEGQWVSRPASCEPRLPGQAALNAWLEGWYQPPCSVLWSRAAYERSGGWDERCSVNDDGLLMMRALADGAPLVNTSRGDAYYRRAPDGAASLSRRRYTHDGLASRIHVLDAVAAALGKRTAKRPLARSLGFAYDVIANDCRSSSAALYRQCRERAHQHGGSEVQRATYRTFRHLAAAALRRSQQMRARLAEPGDAQAERAGDGFVRNRQPETGTRPATATGRAASPP